MAEEKKIVKLQVRRGPEAQLPLLSEGEIAVTIDTSKVFYGTGAENIELGRADTLRSLVQQLDLITSAASIDPAVEQMKVGRNGRTYDSARAMVLGESTSEIVNVINPLLEAELPGAYPVGISIFEVGSSDSGFPDSLGTVTTYKLNAYRITQQFTSKVTARTWVRSAGTSEGWGMWVIMQTEDGVKKELGNLGFGANPTNTIAEGTDLNSVTESGFYRLNGKQFLNQPEDLGYSQMLVIHGASDTVTQIIFTYNDPNRNWIRSGNPLIASGKWYDWTLLASMPVVEKKITETQVHKVSMDDGRATFLSEGTDINTLNKSGWYRVYNGANAPASGWLFYMVIQQGNAECLQVGWTFGSRRMFTRYANSGGTFGEWHESVTKETLQRELDEKVNKNGDTMSGSLTAPGLNNTANRGVMTEGDGKQLQVGTGEGDVFLRNTATETYIQLTDEGGLSVNGATVARVMDAQKIADAVNSKQINAMPLKFKSAGTPPSSYPTGITQFSTGSDNTWPFVYSIVTTIRADNGTAAIQYVTAWNNAKVRTMIRAARDVEDEWQDWVENASREDINLTQVHKVTADSGQAIDIRYQDLNNISKTGFYRGVNVLNAPGDDWYFFEVIQQNEGECLQRATRFATRRTLVRYQNAAGVWSEWKMDAILDDVSALKKELNDLGYGSTSVGVIDGADLNTVLTSGNYRGANLINAPQTTSFACHVEVFASNSNTVTQKLHLLDGNRMFFRSKNAGSWNPWKEVATI